MQIMPFEEAKTYRFNPFDLTKVWPHSDYPLIDVGKLTLNRNVTDYHTEIEQAAFEPNNIVPGTGLSPDKMLLARGFSYSDAHRARLGANYKQIPVNTPKVEVNSYSKDGAMRIKNATDPVYAPNSYGGPQADPARAAEVRWQADGDMVRAAYTLRADDDDWGQAGTLVREVLDDDGAGSVGAQHRWACLQGREGAGAVAGVRVLAQRRPRSRQEGRGGIPSGLNELTAVVQGGTLDDAVSQGQQQLVSTIEAEYTANAFGDGNPLYVFGYSQSDVVMGDAEQQLYDFGIPQGDLDFVMVGDSASAEGGFLNSYVDSLPTWLQPWVIEAFNDFGAGDVLGATDARLVFTRTQVYSLSGDGWANYDGGANDLGLYSDHLEYLGLTPQEILTALTACAHIGWYRAIATSTSPSKTRWSTAWKRCGPSSKLRTASFSEIAHQAIRSHR